MAALFQATVLILFVGLSVASLPEGEMGIKSQEETSKEKRDGGQCYVGGRQFQHGQVFNYPGLSECLKYRCNNGGYSIVQEACRGYKGGCIALNSVTTEGCRSLRCVVEDRGSHTYYYLKPTTQDRCEYEGRCVSYNTPFEHSSCVTYRCVATANGGYNFEPAGDRKCRDDINNRCVSPGSSFPKNVNGHYYRNCICTPGGGYSCRG